MNPFLDILIRGTGAFIMVIVISRAIGNSQVGQLTISDFVNAILIGSVAANMVTSLNESGWPLFLGLS